MNEKLEFSEEMLSPLTRQKEPDMELEEPQSTAKKLDAHQAEMISTPASSKPYERGLKSLAYEAYIFVAQQRRTSYKEVAMSLVLRREDYDEVHRKSEMNIKRRVYDALNVLIAVGLLKRKGNRISARQRLRSEEVELNA